ncbi:MAG: AIR carboxylase family protein, partial [Candidatus Sungbacteria bacterium]|nr:AIR carboxylase family protein [Candidatus Sungbacteria bacterium]
GDETRAVLEAKDDITAGDGAKHDVIAGKAELATATTSNIFRLLAACGIPVAFQKQLDAVHFLAERCAMLPYEVVVRREAHGSYPKRHPHLKKGYVFPRLLTEFFLKTKGKMWEGRSFPKDDPHISFGPSWSPIHLYRPDVPVWHEEAYIFTLDEFPGRENRHELFPAMSRVACQAFLVLEKAWQLLGQRLVDFKVEFGFNQSGDLRLADVIDNDSWRVLGEGGRYIDKQLYRDGAPLNEVTAQYRRVAELTGRFGLPRQSIVLWRGSEKDDLKPFHEAIAHLGFHYREAAPSPGEENTVVEITRSAHKQPALAYQELAGLVQETPDTVVIAYVGRSNGLGPMLAANTTVPVITVPASVKDFPDDVWSSLRMPTDVPVMTVLEPKNAVLAALQILAMRNPRLYAELRLQQEERLTNVVELE